MNTTTLTKLSMNVLNANKLVNYLLDENINLSGTIMLGLLGSLEMYKNIIETRVEDNSIVYIFDTKLVNFYTKNIYIKNIQIYTVNIKEDDFEDFAVKLKNMPKFDYIIQNPPYSKSLHLDFLKAGYNMLSDTGKMIIIEPSTFYINIRKNGKAKNYNEIKKLIKDHVYKVIIENYNKEFNTAIYFPFAITYIDKAKTYNNIDVNICGEYKNVTSLYDINLIGNYNLIWSILDKINYDKVKNHLYLPNKSNKKEGNYYCKFAGITANMCGCGNRFFSNEMFRLTLNKDYYFAFTAPLFHSDRTSDIQNYPNERRTRGGVKIEGSEAECITGTKEELENWKYFVFNNSLPLFINICMTIDQNNNSLPYVPWLVDKKYTDKEIYDMFGFTNEEIKLIETTIKKYERYSPWFKRYICGPSLVSDEEVQKFINELENA